MWSIANEARTHYGGSNVYFGEVARFLKEDIDGGTSRPATTACHVQPYEDQATKYLDIASFNRYHGWYVNAGRLDMIKDRIIKEAVEWHEVKKN